MLSLAYSVDVREEEQLGQIESRSHEYISEP